MRINFEFDPEKSASNKAKHGVNFVEAQTLWLDPQHCEIALVHAGESRQIVIGKMQDRIWSAVVTRRAQRLRIISVRRARQKEIETYEAPR